MLRSKFTKFLSFVKQQISFCLNFALLFSVITRISSILFWPKFYIVSKKWACQSRNLVKFHMSTRKSEILYFDGFLLSKSYKVSAKKVKKSYLSWHWRLMQSLKKKTDLWFQIWHEKFGEFSPNHSKVQKLLSNVLFLSKVCKVWAKKMQRIYLSWHSTLTQNLNKPWPCGSKNGMKNWVDFL